MNVGLSSFLADLIWGILSSPSSWFLSVLPASTLGPTNIGAGILML